jgi:multidrug efflux pump subunit AcrA (membrane-fusion protein)
MTASVTAAEFPGQPFAGRVDRTSEAIDPRSGTLHVEILAPNPQLKLLPGMYVSATLQLANPLGFRVPASAVVFRPDGPVVATVAQNGTLNFRHVRIAKDLGDFIELAAGVTSKDRVVLNVPTDITDGQHVTVAADSAGRTANGPAPLQLSAKGS